MSKNKNQAVIPASALSRVLSVVSRGAGRNGLYEMVQVAVRDGTLTAQCFNGTMGVSVQTAVEDHGSGIGAMVNAQAFVSLVSNMNGAATLTQEARKGLKVECDSVSVSIKGTQTGELPGLEEGDAKEVCSLSGEALNRALQVSVSAHPDDKSPILHGVLFEVGAERLITWRRMASKVPWVQGESGKTTRSRADPKPIYKNLSAILSAKQQTTTFTIVWDEAGDVGLYSEKGAAVTLCPLLLPNKSPITCRKDGSFSYADLPRNYHFPRFIHWAGDPLVSPGMIGVKRQMRKTDDAKLSSRGDNPNQPG